MRTVTPELGQANTVHYIRKLQRIVVAWTLLFSTGTSVPGQDNANELQIDHHVHLFSEALIDDWKLLGMRFSRANDFYADASTVLQMRSVVTSMFITGIAIGKAGAFV